MSSSTWVADSRDKLEWMVAKEMRRPGDGGGALQRIITRHKLRAAAVKAVLYSNPIDIYVSVYLSIAAAYEAEVSRWERNIAHERAIAHAKTGVGAALLRFADRLDGLVDTVNGETSAAVVPQPDVETRA